MLFRVDMWVSLATDLNTYDFMEFLYYKQIDTHHLFVDIKTAFAALTGATNSTPCLNLVFLRNSYDYAECV